MKKKTFDKFFAFLLIASFAASTSFAQRRNSTAKTAAKPIVFAVLNDGKSLEPIALIDKGALVPASDGGDESAKILNFTKTYYKPNAVYKLVFGGVEAGSVTVKGSNPKAECAPNMAQAVYAAPKAKLKGMVMALATNAAVKKGTGVRRLPTPSERVEIESLVRAEFVKNKVAANAAKNLKYHNLTALDVDADGKPEMVGSFWVETAATERALLFFIAEQDAKGKYKMGFSEFRTVKQEEVMSEDIKALDEGVYHELLLDAMEYDGDTTAEIFTYIQGFEGSSFTVYSRRDGKWVKAFEGSNYHCGY